MQHLNTPANFFLSVNDSLWTTPTVSHDSVYKILHPPRLWAPQMHFSESLVSRQKEAPLNPTLRSWQFFRAKLQALRDVCWNYSTSSVILLLTHSLWGRSRLILSFLTLCNLEDSKKQNRLNYKIIFWECYIPPMKLFPLLSLVKLAENPSAITQLRQVSS